MLKGQFQSLSEEQIKEVKRLTIEIHEKSTGYRQIINGFNKKYDIISNYQQKNTEATASVFFSIFLYRFDFL